MYTDSTSRCTSWASLYGKYRAKRSTSLPFKCSGSVNQSSFNRASYLGISLLEWPKFVAAVQSNLSIVLAWALMIMFPDWLFGSDLLISPCALSLYSATLSLAQAFNFSLFFAESSCGKFNNLDKRVKWYNSRGAQWATNCLDWLAIPQIQMTTVIASTAII